MMRDLLEILLAILGILFAFGMGFWGAHLWKKWREK
jgi:hypothetical protein